MSDKLFKLKSNFEPAGDQPAAIEKLLKGVEKGFDFQTLLGVTGSGKTFTIANIIKELDRPVLVMAPNKSLAAQLYREYKNFFPENAVHYFVSYYDYYQPEAYMPGSDTYIEKEAMINDEIDRLRHGATSALLSRRDVIIVASVSCIYNLGVPVSYMEASLHLEKDKPMTRSDLISQLIKMQFE
ncbi:MAG: DEAD/DEAH box helicase family protein, partial [Patescibacteria group bacterium]